VELYLFYSGDGYENSLEFVITDLAEAERIREKYSWAYQVRHDGLPDLCRDHPEGKLWRCFIVNDDNLYCRDAIEHPWSYSGFWQTSYPDVYTEQGYEVMLLEWAVTEQEAIKKALERARKIDWSREVWENVGYV